MSACGGALHVGGDRTRRQALPATSWRCSSPYRSRYPQIATRMPAQMRLRRVWRSRIACTSGGAHEVAGASSATGCAGRRRSRRVGIDRINIRRHAGGWRREAGRWTHAARRIPGDTPSIAGARVSAWTPDFAFSTRGRGDVPMSRREPRRQNRIAVDAGLEKRVPNRRSTAVDRLVASEAAQRSASARAPLSANSLPAGTSRARRGCLRDMAARDSRARVPPSPT